METFDKSCHEMLKLVYNQNLQIIKDGKKRQFRWTVGFVILGVIIFLGFFI